MAKLQLQPAPVFKCKVKIPNAEFSDVEVEFAFKHKKRDAVLAFLAEHGGMTGEQKIQFLAEGWDLDDAWTDANVAELCQNYLAAPAAVVTAYLGALAGERQKN
jgi:hypothetical protein